MQTTTSHTHRSREQLVTDLDEIENAYDTLKRFRTVNLSANPPPPSYTEQSITTLKQISKSVIDLADVGGDISVALTTVEAGLGADFALNFLQALEENIGIPSRHKLLGDSAMALFNLDKPDASRVRTLEDYIKVLDETTVELRAYAEACRESGHGLQPGYAAYVAWAEETHRLAESVTESLGKTADDQEADAEDTDSEGLADD